MKKIVVFASLLLVSSCTGWSSFNSAREGFVESFSAYDIDYFDHEPKLLTSEQFTEKNNKTNEILTAYKGFTVVASKTYIREHYASAAARINMDGSFNGSSAPIEFKKNDQRPVMGSVNINGAEYFLVASDLEGIVFLIKDSGVFYKKMGQIRNNRLILMETDYVPYPEGLRFEPIMTSATDQTRPINGFDIKYEGLKKGRLAFNYMTFGSGRDGGSFEHVYYVNRPGMININGTKINIISASDERIDYTILE